MVCDDDEAWEMIDEDMEDMGLTTLRREGTIDGSDAGIFIGGVLGLSRPGD